MPVDYSKWDSLELSDDSDIEVHPNVDKRSFIRAKQTQIHQQRIDRKHRIVTLKYERVINDGLLGRIDALLKSLEAHKQDAQGKTSADDVDEVVFDALVEVQGDGSLGPDQPPSPPQGVHNGQEQPSYSKMMGTLVDQVKGEVDKTKAEGDARYAKYVKEVGEHNDKVKGLQKELNTELARLEKEEAGKITSDSIHTGFDSSHVSKPAAPTPSTATATKTSKKEPELLNAPRSTTESQGQSSGADADIEDGSLDAAPGEDDDDDMVASPAAKKFGAIRFGDYNASLSFIGENPSILAEKETDGLLVEAFNAQTNAKSKSDEDYARQCVHQALLLQYCRQLGRDGVGLFFKRVQTPNHQARKLFLDDVNSTYARIRTRTAELAKEAEEEGGDREQIQLHSVDPNTTINIITPLPLDECETDDARTARRIFESFPPGLQRALKSGDLDKVNVVLGEMSVDEAEQIVQQLGDGGMLSLEEGVIDATTEEGRKQIEQIERSNRMPVQETMENERSDALAVEDMD